VLQLRMTTLVEASVTVTFDVARALGRPWPFPLQELSAQRPWRDRYGVTGRPGFRRLTHERTFTPTGAGTLVTEQVDADTGLPRPIATTVERLLLRRRVLRAMQAHLDGLAAAAADRAADVVQVVGAAVVEGGRVLVARRDGGPYDGCWEFPGGKVEPGESELDALVRECREELGLEVAPQAFLGEVVLDGAVGGGAPGASTLRVWWARPGAGAADALEHAELRWVRAEELDDLDWIGADRPLLPAVRALLARVPGGSRRSDIAENPSAECRPGHNS
jgi:8-oxo-dGTP diphosphatase